MISFRSTYEGDKCFVLTGFFIKGGCIRKSSKDGNGCADAESLHFFGRSGGVGLNMMLKSSRLGRSLTISICEYSENVVGKMYDSHAIYPILGPLSKRQNAKKSPHQG